MAESRLPVARRPAPPAGGRRPPGRSRPAAARRPTAGSAGRRPGARARPGQGGAASRRRSAAADPGVQQPVGHVAQHALVLGQEELLEHEPDPRRPQRRQLPVPHPGHVHPGDAHGPGWSAGPGCPSGAAAWTCPTRTGRPSPPAPRPPPSGSPGPAPAPAAAPGTPSTPAPAPAPAPGPSPRPAVPAVMTPPPRRAGRASAPRSPGPGRGVVEDPGRHRHPAPRVPLAGDLHGVPAGRWATSAVTGTASTPRAVPVVMFTVTGAWSRLPAAPGSVSVHLHRDVVVGLCPAPGRGGRHRADRGHHARRRRPVGQRDASPGHPL